MLMTSPSLGLPVEVSKGALLANSKHLLARAAKALASYAGEASAAIRRLGVDHSLTGGHFGAVRKKRFQAARPRYSLMRWFSTKRNDSSQIFVCGILPSVLYGGKLMVPEPREVSRARTQYLISRRLPHVRVCRDIAYSILPIEVDPALRFYELPLLRWAAEWWYLGNPAHRRPHDVLSSKTLNADFWKAVGGFDAKVPYHRHSKDPISMMLYAASVVGWVFENPVVIRNEKGQQPFLMESSVGILRVSFVKDGRSSELREAGATCKGIFLM